MSTYTLRVVNEGVDTCLLRVDTLYVDTIAQSVKWLIPFLTVGSQILIVKNDAVEGFEDGVGESE